MRTVSALDLDLLADAHAPDDGCRAHVRNGFLRYFVVTFISSLGLYLSGRRRTRRTLRRCVNAWFFIENKKTKIFGEPAPAFCRTSSSLWHPLTSFSVPVHFWVATFLQHHAPPFVFMCRARCCAGVHRGNGLVLDNDM